MSSTIDPHSEQPDAEALVAYLDGELPPEECRRVETRLANDAGYRQQMHDLDQAWEALSTLPESRASDDFARTTMELVTVAAQGELKQDRAQASVVRRHRAWQWSGAALVAAFLGFAGAWGVFARNDRVLLDDLPVIRNVNALSQIHDIEFLRELAAKVPAQDLARDEAELKDDVQRLMPTGAEARSTRRAWLESQPDNQKAQLTAQADRFYRQSPQELERLRAEYAQINEAKDRVALQTQLVAYNQWLSGLALAQEEELRALETTEEKVDFIAREVRADREQELRRLSVEDAAKLREVVLEIAKERGPQFEREMRRRNENWLRRLQRSDNGFAMAVVFSNFRDEGIRNRVESALSDDARDRLEQLSPMSRNITLGRWIRDSLRPKFGPGELEQFFTKELPVADRERLLQLPHDEMKVQLDQLYVDQYGDGADWWFDERGGDARWRGGQGRPEFGPGGREMNRRDGPPRDFEPEPDDRDRRRPPPLNGPGAPPPGPPPGPNGPPPQQPDAV